jgi:hypothetical protein
MTRELAVVGAAVVVILVLALWRLDLAGRIRAALAELDGLTVEDDGERM